MKKEKWTALLCGAANRILDWSVASSNSHVPIRPMPAWEERRGNETEQARLVRIEENRIKTILHYRIAAAGVLLTSTMIYQKVFNC